MSVGTFIAQRHGACDMCGEEVKGTECHFVAFGELVHVACPPDVTTLQRMACTSCFLELPVTGVCDECG